MRVLLVVVLGLIAAQAPAAERADLLRAIRDNDVGRVRALVEADPALVRGADDGITPLLAAALARRPEGFRPVDRNPLIPVLAAHLIEPTAFELALLGRGDELLQRVKADPTLLATRLPSGWSLLHVAAFRGDVTLVEGLLSAGAAIDARAARSFQITPVQSALLSEQLEAVRALLSRGADALVRFSDGSSYLHEAALLGNVHAVEMLSSAGVDPLGVRNNGERPLDVAVRHGHVRAADVLLEFENRALAEQPAFVQKGVCADLRAFRTRPELARYVPAICDDA